MGKIIEESSSDRKEDKSGKRVKGEKRKKALTFTDIMASFVRIK